MSWIRVRERGATTTKLRRGVNRRLQLFVYAQHGRELMGFKSPVHGAMRTKVLAEGNCATARLGGKEAGVQSYGPMNKNRISGRVGGVSGHKTTKPFGSTHTVNAAVAERKFTSLSGEIPRGGFAWEVSRRHSSPTPEVMLRTW